jgi:protein-tyrosine sulfotransferase
LEKPIFILGSHKSGTSLLRNLFDGTPDLFVIPNEIHFFQYAGYGVNYALRRATPSKLGFDDVVERIRRAIQYSNTRPIDMQKHGDSYLTGCWNVEAVTDYLRQHGAEHFAQRDTRGFFDCYVEALHVGLYGQPPSARRFVEKSVENAEFAAALKHLYPDATFIHIVRNPYATLVSLRKFKALRRYPYLGTLIDSLRNSYEYLYSNPLHVADYHIVRYEDLLTDPRKQMQQIASIVGIEFGEHLLEPSALGKQWSGNSMSGKDFKGISTQPISAWEKDIYPLETALVNLLFAHVIRDYDYANKPTPSQLYVPMKGEAPKDYVANRFLMRQIRALVEGERNAS